MIIDYEPCTQLILLATTYEAVSI